MHSELTQHNNPFKPKFLLSNMQNQYAYLAHFLISTTLAKSSIEKRYVIANSSEDAKKKAMRVAKGIADDCQGTNHPRETIVTFVGLTGQEGYIFSKIPNTIYRFSPGDPLERFNSRVV